MSASFTGVEPRGGGEWDGAKPGRARGCVQAHTPISSAARIGAKGNPLQEVET